MAFRHAVAAFFQRLGASTRAAGAAATVSGGSVAGGSVAGRSVAGGSVSGSSVAGRSSGPPASSNGASSQHLFWQMPSSEPLVSVSATIEVLAPPPAGRLCFWALQASFSGDAGGRSHVFGAGHFGLQHHPSYPGAGAINWGGYHQAGSPSGASGELDGSELGAPSALGNPNTCDYRWEIGRRYRMTIARTPDEAARRGWRATVVDLSTDAVFVVRDLWCEGDELTRPMVWTESFAHCEEASAVRWSDFSALTDAGDVVRPTGLTVNYQSEADGGCTTGTTAFVDGSTSGADGIEQRTGTVRTMKQGTAIPL